ncbi:MAG: NUDIX domain-containing protein, partial [Candidatus Magasanikbacteria bacterium]|nr:NUDIX domain-containing protein [Candidatus Magasanikbacteria bacterium]
MEYLEIINEDGSSTGETVSRKDAHKKGLWHLCIHLWIINSKHEILIQKRSALKELHPGLWDLSVAGDDAVTAVKKECFEEIGINIDEQKLEHLFDIKYTGELNNGKFIKREFTKIFLINLDVDLNQLKLQKEEVDAVKLINY